MTRRLFVCAALFVLLLSTVPMARASSPFRGWRAGAAVIDITPPPFDAASDAAAFPTCDPRVFTGHRLFQYQEPYVDQNGDGTFEYPEPYCDANLNKRYDGLYLSGAIAHLAQRVHDPIDARAIAVGDSTHTVVIASVVSQGLFETYTHRIRDRARQLRPGISEVIVSANHNESSPDSVGIYGAPDVGGAVGGRSGIDDYYMSFLVEQVAQAAVHAYDAMQPSTLWANQFPLPSNIRVQLSKNFPTTDDAGQPAAIDPKIGVLQARAADGSPIFTVMSLAAHNQQIGHTDASSYDISADWPGAFHRHLAQRIPSGTPMFLVGDNGSEEDPVTVPPVPHDSCGDACNYSQADATGAALADAVASGAAAAKPVAAGAVSARRDEFFVPLENNLFRAASAAGLFGERQAYVNGVPTPAGIGTDLRTEVAVVDLGPDIQLIANPGESFPALMLGSPWGIETAGCPDRPNPPVPTWHARATYRFQVGLADDLIGYLIPAWGFSDQPGVYATTCFNDDSNRDPAGHQHKLETESVGPTAGNLVAEHLTALLDAEPDPHARVAAGRYILADGTLSTHPSGAVGVRLADGTVLRGDDVSFMDYDGARQSAADGTTRGVVLGRDRRVYIDVYPSLPGGQ